MQLEPREEGNRLATDCNPPPPPSDSEPFRHTSGSPKEWGVVAGMRESGPGFGLG